MSNDEKLREQVARIQEVAHEQATAGKRPDFVIVAKWSPLGQLTNATIATAIGELRVLPDPICPNGNEFVGSLDDYPQMKAWTDRDCPHGYGFDCCTQCHEAFHAGRESMTSETKPTHEERARALIPNCEPWAAALKERIAAAFAEVEAEAKRECATAFAKEQCAPIEARIKELIDGAKLPEVRVDHNLTGTQWRLESASAALKKLLPAPGPMTQADVDAVRAEVAWALPACTCGAASCGSRIHSDYCDVR